MTTNIFVNLPVSNLSRSIDFFTKLGFAFDGRFSDEKAACMIIGENMYVMLLVKEFFKTFTKKAVADTTQQAAAILALSTGTREGVDVLANKALEAGAMPSMEPMDQGFMYNRSFEDLDGHLWEVFWMDPKGIGQA